MRYFVAYSHVTGSSSGFGNCILRPLRPIATADDLVTISQQIAATKGLSNVVVIGLTPLPDGEEQPA
ncbi:hypothetical protein [Salinispora arenicola]|uniref:hypothetical protein n=1 Tax=Salinispora arenicola TaxID=168697 RepID=UPI0016B4751A|nr:hypothetical protein [Salinispora arenicola]NIL57111.1 hypothetical protein [Salinispora arenicola]NIL62667.1 hypothetical protein [Salinispora arenicola]